MSSILIVEDEPEIARTLRAYLERDGHRVAVAGDGEAALHAVEAAEPDLVILDLMLPRLDGITVARRLRENFTVPIIMLTARDQEEDKILGLEVGADDYVTKPFSPREVVARVRAVLRRHQRQGRDDLVVDDLRINYRGREVSRGGEPITLTPTEWQLLEVLSSHPGQAFTRSQLMARLRGSLYEGVERTLDVHVRNLRHKLERDPQNPRYVATVYGVGYKFTAGGA